jgi:hypothetical protein
MRINDPKYLGSPADVRRGAFVGAALSLPFVARVAIDAIASLASRGYSTGNPWLDAIIGSPVK